MAKKRQKIILVPSPSPLPSLSLLLVSPAKPISVDKSEDENIKELIEVKDKDIGLLLPLLPIYFISV